MLERHYLLLPLLFGATAFSCCCHGHAVVSAAAATVDGADNFVLNENFLERSLDVAELSLHLVEYDEGIAPTHPFEQVEYFVTGPDRALVAKREGYCFGIFSSTLYDRFDDWIQDLNILTGEVCGPQGECCKARQGFINAYNADFRQDFEDALRECVETTCRTDTGDTGECLILGGFSQGGGVAAVAGVYMADLNPMGIMLATPNTIQMPCAALSTDRWYTILNTITTTDFLGRSYLWYDPLATFFNPPYLDRVGHLIVLSDDTSGVAYLGLDPQQVILLPPYLQDILLVHEVPPYFVRLRAIRATYRDESSGLDYPVLAAGYQSGFACTRRQECRSGKCSIVTGTCK